MNTTVFVHSAQFIQVINGFEWVKKNRTPYVPEKYGGQYFWFRLHRKTNVCKYLSKVAIVLSGKYFHLKKTKQTSITNDQILTFRRERPWRRNV